MIKYGGWKVQTSSSLLSNDWLPQLPNLDSLVIGCSHQLIIVIKHACDVIIMGVELSDARPFIHIEQIDVILVARTSEYVTTEVLLGCSTLFYYLHLATASES